MNSKLARLFTSGSIHLLPGIVVAVVAASTALPAYAQASWSGQIQCQLSIQSAGYAHEEVQTWQLTSDPPTLNGAMPMYSASWSVTGQGTTQKTLPTRALAAEWKTASPPTTVVFAIFKRASDQRLVIKRYTRSIRSHRSGRRPQSCSAGSNGSRIPISVASLGVDSACH